MLAVTFILLIHNGLALTTIVVGNCAVGDYQFDDLYEALKEASNHTDVNIVICDDQELRWGRSVYVDDFWMSGGTITSDGERIRIVGDDVVIRDVNFIGTRLQIVATGDVLLENIRSSVPDYRYCIELNTTTDITLNKVTVSSCEYGIYVERADELNVWSVYTEDETEALKIDTQNVTTVYLNPVKIVEERIIEKIVEKNIPITEIEYRVPPELQKELDRCKELVGILQDKKSELERKVYALTNKLADAEKQKVYPDTWAVMGVLVAGLAVGYVLGRM